MPKGKSKITKPQIPKEGWGRCVDCMAKNYEIHCHYLNIADTTNKVNDLESAMAECENTIELYLKRERAGTNYDPKEDTCICCDYVSEYKKEIESGKMSVITSIIEFKSLCKEYMKKYKKVKDIPITKRSKKRKRSE